MREPHKQLLISGLLSISLPQANQHSLEPILDHMFGPALPKSLGNFGPSIAPLEDVLCDFPIFSTVPMSAK